MSERTPCRSDIASFFLMALISWAESDSNRMDAKPLFLQKSTAPRKARLSTISGEATCPIVCFIRRMVDVVCIVHANPAFLSSCRHAASEQITTSVVWTSSCAWGVRGEESFSIFCIWSHSLATLIAVDRASAGDAELPLKTNLLRPFHSI